MNSETAKETNVAKWFVGAAIVACLWNLTGVMAFVNQQTMDLAQLPEKQRLFFESYPLWANAGFALAVFAGLAGSIGLLMRRRWAQPLLILSVIGVVIQAAYTLLLGNGLEVFGSASLGLPLLTLAIGIGLIWLAGYAERRNWLT